VRVLVTGASGFVGGFLAPRLRADGWDVVGCDQEVDVTDASAVARHVAQVAPDAIIHLAAQSSVALSWQNPALTYRVNFLGSRSILEAAAEKTPAARVMLVGSADQYGSSEPGAPPLDESAPLRPRSPYARTKAAADRLGERYAEDGLDVIRIRAFNHSGPGQSDTFVMSSWARQAAEIACGKRAPMFRVGNLDSVRDFLDVEDVVDAYARLLDRQVPAGAYNVASGRGVRLRDMLEQLLALAGIQPKVEIDPERMRPLDVSVGNSDRLRAATGWEPRIPLERSLERLLESWRTVVSAP
jgi:GDP-4-dehydro-6-deoxy-D-mannose reductase